MASSLSLPTQTMKERRRRNGRSVVSHEGIVPIGRQHRFSLYSHLTQLPESSFQRETVGLGLCHLNFEEIFFRPQNLILFKICFSLHFSSMHVFMYDVGNAQQLVLGITLLF